MIAGVATDTIVVSTRIMKKPMHSANRAGQGLTSAGAHRRGACGRGGSVWAMTTLNTRRGQSIPRAGGIQRSFSHARDNGAARTTGTAEVT